MTDAVMLYNKLADAFASMSRSDTVWSVRKMVNGPVSVFMMLTCEERYHYGHLNLLMIYLLQGVLELFHFMYYIFCLSEIFSSHQT